MRGRKWEPEWDQVLVERFADELNAVLAKELGCGERTLVRHARRLGLEKSESFRRKAQERAKRIKAIRDRAWDERVRIINGMSRKTGWKMVDYCKGKVK